MPDSDASEEANGSNPEPGPSTSTALAQVSPAPPAPVSPAPNRFYRTPAPPPPAPYVPGYDGPHDFPTMWRMAESLARATILPRHFHDAPGNVFAVMTQARAANLPVFVALQHMNVIDGRVEESAELVRAMLLRAGYGFEVVAATQTEATVHLTRPDGKVKVVTFTLVEAQQMELAQKRNWRLNPSAMLVARATTRAASWHAPEVTMGLANLSHGDLGTDVPEALAHLREADPDLEAAAEAWRQALEADTVDEVRAIGTAAREQGLLDLAVEGVGLQVRLMERIAELREEQAQPALPVDDGDWLPCGCVAARVLATGEHEAGCEAGQEA